MSDIVLKEKTDQMAAFPPVRRKGRFGLFLSFVFFVLLPMVIASVYYFSFAVSVFESSASVAVRKEGSLSSDQVGVAVGASSALSIFSDSFIVADYVQSREVLEGVMSKVDVHSIFLKGKLDPRYHLSPDARIEELSSFWRKMVDAEFDASTGIIRIKIRAFTPEDTVEIAKVVVQLMEGLVARLSEKAQQEAVRFAEMSVKEALEELQLRRSEMQKFRIENQIVDPKSEVENLNTLINTLSQELVEYKTERAIKLTLTPENSPIIKQLDIQIATTAEEIARIKQGLNVYGPKKIKLPELLRSYEILQTDMMIASEKYTKALERLGSSNAVAALRQAHLFVFVEFSKPQSPSYPSQPLAIIQVLLICLGVWGISRLVL